MDGESVEEIRKQEELQRQRAKEAALAAEKAAKEAAEIERKRKIECEVKMEYLTSSTQERN